eukprot:TRINITY_DN20617_c0_g1_i1.p1 TRINITY_DN20617_c0_g1~~TRINITY_DN20617_c0_g1_i1.p1  ORF type:complete len:273 (+),score=33.53 TRINITY_DN20617_c0_g1_i1:102-920(+)
MSGSPMSGHGSLKCGEVVDGEETEPPSEVGSPPPTRGAAALSPQIVAGEEDEGSDDCESTKSVSLSPAQAASQSPAPPADSTPRAAASASPSARAGSQAENQRTGVATAGRRRLMSLLGKKKAQQDSSEMITVGSDRPRRADPEPTMPAKHTVNRSWVQVESNAQYRLHKHSGAVGTRQQRKLRTANENLGKATQDVYQSLAAHRKRVLSTFEAKQQATAESIDASLLAIDRAARTLSSIHLSSQGTLQHLPPFWTRRNSLPLPPAAADASD